MLKLFLMFIAIQNWFLNQNYAFFGLGFLFLIAEPKSWAKIWTELNKDMSQELSQTWALNWTFNLIKS